MDSLTVVQVLQLIEASNSAKPVTNINWTEVIMALITVVAGFITVYKSVQLERVKKATNSDNNKYKLSSQSIEQESADNRIFQQEIVKTTQESYTDIVNRLMGTIEISIKDVQEKLGTIIVQFERQYASTEFLNKRFNTVDRTNKEMLYEFIAELYNFLEHVADTVTVNEKGESVLDLKLLRERYKPQGSVYSNTITKLVNNDNDDK